MSSKPKDISSEVRAIWDANAEWWDDKIGPEGNSFHQALIGPAQERLLDIRPGEVALDIACGNGQFTRRLAELGATVVAFDFSTKFIERARAHTAKMDYGDKIEFHVMDATDEAQLRSLGDSRFDAAVCTMAIMDMAEIDPLLRAIPRLLKLGGRFVFSVLHPCFNHSGIKRVIEQEDREGELVSTYGVNVIRYTGNRPTKGIGIPGQPVPQIYFDRTLSELFNACFRAGLLMDGLEEPTFGPEDVARTAFSWENFRETPPVMVARLRPSTRQP